MIEFADFQCPYCSKFAADTLPTLERTYVESGRIKITFMHLPLSMHPLAEKAAVTAECAGRQGQFWQMHDALFARQGKLDETLFDVSAPLVSLEPSAFRACVAADGSRRVHADAQLAQHLGITATPTFLFGTVDVQGRAKISTTLSGAVPLAQFERTLDGLLGTVVASRER